MSDKRWICFNGAKNEIKIKTAGSEWREMCMMPQTDYTGEFVRTWCSKDERTSELFPIHR